MYAFGEVGVAEELDAPTMGTLWVCRDVSILSIQFAHLCSNCTFIVDQVCSLQPRWATGMGRGTYNAYVAVLDQLTPDRVRWTPYISMNIHSRAPCGLLEMSYHDQDLWCTRKHLLFDIFIE